MSSAVAVRRALRHLQRTTQRLEPDYRRALDRNDTQWLRDNFVPMTTAVLDALMQLADAVIEGGLDQDLEFLEPTYAAAVRFVKGVSEATGIPIDLSS